MPRSKELVKQLYDAFAKDDVATQYTDTGQWNMAMRTSGQPPRLAPDEDGAGHGRRIACTP